MQHFFRRYELSFIKTTSIHSRSTFLILKLSLIRAISVITLTNEAIYNRLIEFKLSKSFSIIQEFTEAQLAELRVIITEFRILEPSRSFEDLGSLEKIELISIISVNEDKIDRFNLNDIGFFDSFYKGKFIDISFIIEYIDKSIFFRDIYIFIDRVKDVARVKSDILLRQNLQIYLRGIAFA